MLLADFKSLKIEAMKAHDTHTVSALNVIISKLMSLTIDKRAKGEEMTDADTLTVLKKAEKELIEERDGYLSAGRTETVEQLNAQLEVVKKYLPQMMSADEIKEIILKLDDKSVPSVMRHFKSQYNGKCDMKLVSETLKNL